MSEFVLSLTYLQSYLNLMRNRGPNKLKYIEKLMVNVEGLI